MEKFERKSHEPTGNGSARLCLRRADEAYIVVTYMGFTEEQTETLLTESEDDEETFKRNFIIRWSNKNSEAQAKVNFSLFHFITDRKER